MPEKWHGFTLKLWVLTGVAAILTANRLEATIMQTCTKRTLSRQE
jgi:hypothetical protein